MSEVKVLSKEAFIQQYVLSNGTRYGSAHVIISDAEDVFEAIKRACKNDTNNQQ